MSADNGNDRTGRIKIALAEAAERYRQMLDYDQELVQVIFLVQFRPTGEIKRTIVKPESHHEEGPAQVPPR